MSTTQAPLVLSHTEDHIGILTLNRPDKRNALSFDMVTALKDTLQAAIDDPMVKVILIQAEGKAFCSGADLESLQKLQTNTYEENLADTQHLKELFQMVYTSPKPTLSLVEGPALAGGCGLATLTDFCFASSTASFGYTEVRIGFIPALVSVYLQKKLGDTRARQLLLSADILSAEEAKHWHLVYQVAEAGAIKQLAYDFAKRLSVQNAGPSMAATKALMLEVAEIPLEEALLTACHANAKTRASEACQRGIAAFLNKEKIVW